MGSPSFGGRADFKERGFMADIIELLTVAIVNGIGITAGTYLANRALIKNIEKLDKMKKLVHPKNLVI